MTSSNLLPSFLPSFLPFLLPPFPPLPFPSLNQVGYLDAGKEQRRREKLDLWKATGENPFLKKKKVEKWSEAKGKKEERKTKRDERKKEKTSGKQKRKAAGLTDDELKDLADDIRLIKKFKKGKIDDGDFEEAFCKDEDEHEGDTAVGPSSS